MKNVKRVFTIVIVGIIMALYFVPTVNAVDMVNINTATIEELVTLKHVGEKIAARIIEYRKKHPFVVIEDIMKVKGVGQKIFDTNKNKITV